MSSYYTIANHTRGERLDLSQIGRGDRKYASVAFGDASKILAFMMAGLWRGDHVVVLDDELDADRHMDRIAGYTDVSASAVGRWNESAENLSARGFRREPPIAWIPPDIEPTAKQSSDPEPAATSSTACLASGSGGSLAAVDREPRPAQKEPK